MTLDLLSPATQGNTPLKILLAGYGALAVQLLEGLLEYPELCHVVGVFRWQNRYRPRSLPRALWQGLQEWITGPQPEERRLRMLIRDHGLTEMTSSGLGEPDFMQQIAEAGGAAKGETVVLIASWGDILSQAGLDRIQATGCRIVNAHPSLLPAHRGPNPYVSSIQEGDTTSGVTFHDLTARVDAGPVHCQVAVPVQPYDTGGTLRDRCALAARDTLPELLMRLHNPDSFAPVPQNETLASYYPQSYIEAVDLDFGRDPGFLERQVRARQPWTPCLAYCSGRFPVAVSALRVIADPTPRANPLSPGTLLAIEDHHLVVASSQPGRVLELGQLKLYSPVGYLPKWLSRWLIRLWFRRGQRLTGRWDHPW